jgi:hypothetical protein
MQTYDAESGGSNSNRGMRENFLANSLVNDKTLARIPNLAQEYEMTPCLADAVLSVPIYDMHANHSDVLLGLRDGYGPSTLAVGYSPSRPDPS